MLGKYLSRAPGPHSPTWKCWGRLQAPLSVAVSARTCTLYTVPARRPPRVTWVSVRFTGSSVWGGNQAPMAPLTPRLGSGRGMSLSPAAGRPHHGSGVADMSEGLPSTCLALRACLASAHQVRSGLEGVVKTLESNCLVL